MLDFLRLQARRRLPRAEARFLEDLVGRVGAEAVERVNQELPNRAGVGLFDQLAEQFLGDVLRRRLAAEREADFDLERIAAIHGRRARRRGVELARHHLVQSLENQLFADRRDAVGRRRGDPRALNRLVERLGLFAAHLSRVRAARNLGRRANLARDARTTPAKTSSSRTARSTRPCLPAASPPAGPSSTPYGCGLISFGSGGSDFGRAGEVALVAIGIDVVQRDVRIGDRRLREILVDAAAAADVLGFQLDRHPRAVRLLDPFDAVLGDRAPPLSPGRDVDPFAAAVENLRLVLLGVDLDFVVVGRLLGVDLAR